MKYFIQLNLLFLSLLPAHAANQSGKFCGVSCSPEQELAKSFDAFTQSIPQSNCPKSVITPTDSPMAIGARKIIALTYGSCDALNLPVRDKLEQISSKLNIAGSQKVSMGHQYKNNEISRKLVPQILNSNPYLKPLTKEECSTKSACENESLKAAIPGVLPACKQITCDAILHPPLYQYGGKVDGDDGIVPHRKSINGGAVDGMDCSFFIFNAMKASGLKRAPDAPINEEGSIGWDTKDFATFGRVDAQGKPLDCFERLDATADIKPGDIIVAPKNHIVMVDTVGKDPFGIEALLRKSNEELYTIYKNNETNNTIDKKKIDASLSAEQLNLIANTICSSQIDGESFKVTIAHSSPHGNNVGVQRETVGAGLASRKPALETAFYLFAWNKCLNAFQEKWGSKASNNATNAYLSKNTQVGTGKIIRHVPGRPGCTTAVPNVPGIGCANCCDLSASYEKQTGELR